MVAARKWKGDVAMKWNGLMACLLGAFLLLACNLSPDLFSPQEEIRGMGEIRVTAATTATPGPVTVSVSPDGSGDYPSLEAAVEEVPEGSTIILEAGTFLLTEPLSVTKALTLVGAGMDQTELVSGAEGHVVHFSGDGPFTAQGITFRHQGDKMARTVDVKGGEIDFSYCRFTGAVWDEDEEFGGIGLMMRENTTGLVRECRMEENALHGVAVQEQAEIALERNICRDNIQAGIRFSGTSGGTARQNECTGNGLSGIIVKDQAHPTLEGNICTGNEGNGIAYFEDAGGTAQDNECSDNGLHGISIDEQAQTTLEGNVCRYNEQVGIRYADSAGGTVRQNECSANKLTGIAVVEQAQPILERNICVGNRWGIWVEETANPELVDNDCRDNSEADVEDRRVAARPTTELTVTAGADDDQVPSTPSATPELSFDPITFSLEIVEDTNEPINPATIFPAGPTRVYGTFDYEGMTADMKWTRTWYIDDVDVWSVTERWDEDPEWSGESSGRKSISIFWQSGRPLDSGNYELRLLIEGQLVQSGTFVIE